MNSNQVFVLLFSGKEIMNYYVTKGELHICSLGRYIFLTKFGPKEI